MRLFRDGASALGDPLEGVKLIAVLWVLQRLTTTQADPYLFSQLRRQGLPHLFKNQDAHDMVACKTLPVPHHRNGGMGRGSVSKNIGQLVDFRNWGQCLAMHVVASSHHTSNAPPHTLLRIIICSGCTNQS